MFQFNLRREVWEQHNADWWVRGHKRAFKHVLLRLPLLFLFFFCFVLFLSEKPFYLREVYLPTDCTDCVVAYEEVISGQDTFTSLLLFSRAAMTPRLDSIVSTDLKPWSHFFGFCRCRQEKERLIWRSGGPRKKSNVSQDASAYNRWLKLWSDNTLCELCAMHTFANVSLACVCVRRYLPRGHPTFWGARCPQHPIWSQDGPWCSQISGHPLWFSCELNHNPTLCQNLTKS